MINKPSDEFLNSIPKLYATDVVPLNEKIICAHFYTVTDCHWYICEYDGEDLFYGYCVLNGWYDCAELGYVSYSELKECRVAFVEVIFDTEWIPKKFSEIELG